MGHLSAVIVSLAPEHQHYLLEARQIQALSFAVHIPLVCFGIAFPEWPGWQSPRSWPG